MRFQHELFRDDVEVPVVVTCRAYYDDTAPGSLGCPRGLFVEDIVVRRMDTGEIIATEPHEDDVITDIAVKIAQS